MFFFFFVLEMKQSMAISVQGDKPLYLLVLFRTTYVNVCYQNNGKIRKKKNVKPTLGLKIDITGDKPVSIRLCMYIYVPIYYYLTQLILLYFTWIFLLLKRWRSKRGFACSTHLKCVSIYNSVWIYIICTYILSFCTYILKNNLLIFSQQFLGFQKGKRKEYWVCLFCHFSGIQTEPFPAWQPPNKHSTNTITMMKLLFNFLQTNYIIHIYKNKAIHQNFSPKD